MAQENKVLVIDDEISVCKGCKRIFEEEGCFVETALSGKEGLDKAREEFFDVIIVDLKMPDISGMEVLRNIRREQPDVAVVVITGYASVPSAIEAMKLGAEDYLPKPFTPDEVNLVVEKALRRKKEVKEGIVNKEEVLYVVFQHVLNLITDILWASQPDFLSFNNGVGTVNAFEWASPFSLDIAHPPLLQVGLVVES